LLDFTKGEWWGGLLLRVFDKIYRGAIADKTFRSQFGLSDREEELVRH